MSNANIHRIYSMYKVDILKSKIPNFPKFVFNLYFGFSLRQTQGKPML